MTKKYDFFTDFNTADGFNDGGYPTWRCRLEGLKMPFAFLKEKDGIL